ncbi:hypothetical protein E2562_020481 [Oryza meyeriana var. granulata]|uniref:Uncharacterized protein n=1 Tax=Oryza meyeriana var. granulata TaxID=110450 RepID=A0A6G1D5X4_9ORYZ|nr:hypothetical protein E2562_020481 [Oryza meyeriana var. granulata]
MGTTREINYVCGSIPPAWRIQSFGAPGRLQPWLRPPPTSPPSNAPNVLGGCHELRRGRMTAAAAV